MKMKYYFGLQTTKRWAAWLKESFCDTPILLDQLFGIVASFHEVIDEKYNYIITVKA